MPETRTDVVPSRLLLFDASNRPFDPRDKSLRLGQGVLRQLKLRNQYTVFIDNDQPIALFHSPPPFEVIQ